ncbi:hypothetical protein [Streptomyces collinus]|uniref:hypothetical protein n=1 Tax=Streptomyces collinus TaxID=42684 RepID=UPI0036A6D729
MQAHAALGGAGEVQPGADAALPAPPLGRHPVLAAATVAVVGAAAMSTAEPPTTSTS